MSNRLLTFSVIAVSIFLAGCATKRVPFAAVQCPPDKSLIYVYWPEGGPSGDILAIDVNGDHRALIHAHGYYPLFLDPGSVGLGYSMQAYPGFPMRIGNTNALTLQLQSGESYYVAYRRWTVWMPKLLLVTNGSGQQEVAKCTLGKEWQ